MSLAKLVTGWSFLVYKLSLVVRMAILSGRCVGKRPLWSTSHFSIAGEKALVDKHVVDAAFLCYVAGVACGLTRAPTAEACVIPDTGPSFLAGEAVDGIETLASAIHVTGEDLRAVGECFELADAYGEEIVGPGCVNRAFFGTGPAVDDADGKGDALEVAAIDAEPPGGYSVEVVLCWVGDVVGC